VVIEIGAVVGYLAAHLLRGTRDVADSAIGELVDELAAVVVGKLGGRSLDGLSRAPRDGRVQKRLGDRISAAARRDARFREDLAALLEELDDAGGRTIINSGTFVQASGGSHAAGRDLTIVDIPDPSDMSGAPGWIKLCIGLGTLVCLAGMFIFGYTLFTEIADANVTQPSPGTPPGIPLAAAVFFAGFVLMGIGAFGRAVTPRH
jgi:hypothetical protein